jgi:hypothetical protein
MIVYDIYMMKQVHATLTIKVILSVEDPVYDQVDQTSAVVAEAIENLENVLAVEDIKSSVTAVFNR